MTTFYARTGKRALDLALAGAALLLLIPVLGLVAVTIRAVLGKPVLFRQPRPGLHGVPFVVLKFRTMRETDGAAATDAERLGRLGRFLRLTSLDELPQLFNVIAGDMSLVGPRPLLLRYLDRYTPDQARRHEVKPGVTGWAQVNGRNLIAWEEKLALDVWYVDHVSLRTDLLILARTIPCVLRRRGVSAPGQATAPEFLGSER